MGRQFLLLSLIVVSITATAPIKRVIFGCDTNWDYLSFWPVVAQVWNNLGYRPTLAFVAPLDTPIDETIGDVIRFEPIPGYSTANQAQVIRLFLPAFFEDDICMLSDIDMIPLSAEYFNGGISQVTENNFVIFRDKAYAIYGPNYFKKYPMCYNAALGKTFKALFKVDNINDELCQRVRALLRWNYGWQTDEMALQMYIKHRDRTAIKVKRLGHGVEARVDRGMVYVGMIYDEEQLTSGKYIDIHCPRPYTKYRTDIDEVLLKAGVITQEQLAEIHFP